MGETFDCIIIGGGITGASIAYHLTKKGCRDVLLLEKDHLASKATSVCPGGIRAQWQDEAACLYAREAVKFFENLEEELRPDFPLPGLEGYFQAAGFSGHGYMLSPSVGLVIAEMVLGEEPSLPVEPFSFGRFVKNAHRDGLVI